MPIDAFLKNNIIMFCAGSIGSFFNLLYQILMLRLLSKEAFASLNSVISLFVIVSVPAFAFSSMVTKHISTHNARQKYECLKATWQTLSRHALVCSLAFFTVVFLLKQGISDFLHLASAGSVVILAVIFFFTGVSSVVIGGLQGLEFFGWLAILTVLGGILKLSLSVFLVKSIPNGLNAALLGFLFPMLITILISSWPLRFLLKGIGQERIALKPLYVYILPVLLVNLSFALLTNIDMVLARHFFAHGAQDYAVAQMIGKIILSLPGVIYIVMFSRVAGLHALSESSVSILKRSLSFTFFLSALAALGFNLFPHFAFGLIAGPVSPQVILLGRFFSLSMLFFALSNVLFFYQLSIERYSFILPLILIGLFEIAAICFFHKAPLWIVCITLISSCALFLVNLRITFRVAR